MSNNVPNLDAQTPEFLMNFWMKYQRPTRKNAAALVGKRKGYTTLCGDLAGYASNRATAMQCRLRGDIQAALIYESICDRIYSELPSDLRW